MPLPYECDLQHPILWNLGDIHFSDALYFDLHNADGKHQILLNRNACKFLDSHLFVRLICIFFVN